MKTSRYQVKSTFFETFLKHSKSRSPVPKRLPEHTKTETFPISRVIMVSMSRKEAIFDGISTKEYIVDTFPVDNKDIIDGEVYEATVMEIDDL